MSAHRVCVALGLLACANASSLAHADVRPLVRGWTMHERALPSGVEDVGCGDDVAYARNWFGNVAAWNGSSWSALSARPDPTYGRTLTVSPGGVLYVGGGDHVARWDGSRWDDLALTTWAGDMDDQMLAPTDDELVVVGWGRVARLEAGALATYDAGTWRELHGVAMDGADLLVAGQGGTILRRRGGAWTRETTGITATVRRLFAAGPGDVWAVAGESWQASTVLHLEAGVWTPRPMPVAAPVNGLGGHAGLTMITTEDVLLRWDVASSAWTPELTRAELGEGYHTLDGVCATRSHILVGDGGGALLVRPL